MSDESVRKIEDGGPAFPMPCGTGQEVGSVVYNKAEYGMSLRAYFAANAQLDDNEPSIFQAKGVMGEAPPHWPPYTDTTDFEQCRKCVEWWAAARSKLRCIMADAMIAELRKTGGGA